jgi:predicted AAA+ superfamily ATPase
VKAHYNAGTTPRLSYFRDAHGLEVDLVVDRGADLLGIEAKSGATVSPDAFAALDRVAALLPELAERLVVHGGDADWSTRGSRALPHRELDTIAWSRAPTRRRPATRRRPR